MVMDAPSTWLESYNAAIANGGRLLTIKEFNDIYVQRMGVPFNPNNNENDDYSLFPKNHFLSVLNINSVNNGNPSPGAEVA